MRFTARLSYSFLPVTYSGKLLSFAEGLSADNTQQDNAEFSPTFGSA